MTALVDKIVWTHQVTREGSNLPEGRAPKFIFYTRASWTAYEANKRQRDPNYQAETLVEVGQSEEGKHYMPDWMAEKTGYQLESA